MTNLFGTDGIRTTIGKQPLTLEHLIHLGRVLAQHVITRHGKHAQVLLAHDTRISCSFVKSALTAGLLTQPIIVHDAQVLPTPAVFQLINTQSQFHGGIIISASHNPHYDNGIKIVDARTGKLSAQDEHAISQLFYNEAPLIDYNSLGTQHAWHNASSTYLHTILKQFPTNFLHGKTIVLDCAHGATSDLAPRIFEQCGARVITLHNTPNGTNINKQCGALYPQGVQKAVVEHNADAGFAFDGDGDRTIAVSCDGEVKNGDDMLALLLEHPNYASTHTIVGTVMTNQGLESTLTQKNIRLMRTPVGDKHVAKKLTQENVLIGGEQSGHIIMRDYLNTGDGIMTALRVLEAIAHSGNTTMQTFEKYPQVLINVPIDVKHDLDQEPFTSIIAASTTQLHNGRILVRYSGTEHVLRVMIEDTDQQHAQTIGNTLAHTLQKKLNQKGS